MKLRVILQGLAICALVWGGVIVAQKFFGSYKTTAKGIVGTVEEAEFEDWSGRDDEPQGAVAEKRREKLEEIATMMNRLDFLERERLREGKVVEDLLVRLSPGERREFFELTKESIERWMVAFEGLPEEEKKKFIKKALKEFESGLAAEDIERLDALGDKLLDGAMEMGVKAYLENTSAETKMELVPVIEKMQEIMQGLRGQAWEEQ